MATLAQGVELGMLAWFPVSKEETSNPRKHFSESELRGISDILRRTGKESWSRIPRIYSVLRTINQLQTIEVFLSQGISDVWFPFTHKTLPEGLKSPSMRYEFLEAQRLVLCKALDLERETGKHRNFSQTSELPFIKVGDLGKGGYSYVDRVISTISHKEYARKLIPRGRTFKKDYEVLKSFEKELGNLKKLSHPHIVELIGSYTDPRFVGIIMSPVADCNLKKFLDSGPSEITGQLSFLRTFFGCLTAALCYLHENCIRHKDIKPANILVKGHHVYLADFGISLDWTDFGNSTTTGPATAVTHQYCAPEVADYFPRNSSSGKHANQQLPKVFTSLSTSTRYLVFRMCFPRDLDSHQRKDHPKSHDTSLEHGHYVYLLLSKSPGRLTLDIYCQRKSWSSFGQYSSILDF